MVAKIMDTRQATAERILNKGVRFKIPTPLFFRLLRLNRITVTPLLPGTILEFSRVVLHHKLAEALLTNNYEFLTKSIEPVAHCVAISILNSRLKIKWFEKILTRWLLWRMHTETLLKIFVTVESMNRTGDFMNITKYYVRQTMMMTNANLGQTENGR